uniref:BAR/IMD domain containing adaptor protein 2 like 2b n=1 Tax=Oryzias sinensis TaxID=183150 RepID=A0A8C7WNH4_9TELE
MTPNVCFHLQFQWFQVEVLQAMEKNVKLDEEYIDVSLFYSCVFETWISTTTFSNSEYMLYLRQSQQEILKEEQRRYRFLAEKHCGLTQSLLFLINKVTLQSEETQAKRNANKVLGGTFINHPSYLVTTIDSIIYNVFVQLPEMRTSPSPLPSRSRSSSVGESLGLSAGRTMRAVVSHPSSSNPKLLPFNRGETIIVLVQEPRNGWLYGRTESTLQGWFPAAYVAPIEDFTNTLVTRLSQSLSCHSGSVRSYSMNSLLDSEHSEAKSYGDVPVPAPASRRASVDVRTISPLPDKKLEAPMETKPPPPPPPPPPPFSQNLRRGSADFRSVSPLGTNPFATVKLRPTSTNDRSAPHIH